LQVTCNMTVHIQATRPIRFPKDACAVNKGWWTGPWFLEIQRVIAFLQL
jgi:hypothetical protein